MVQTVALVGESGSGKSTVISLLQRFYDPDSGNITIDGINIQNFKLKWLRQQMGLVSQEPVLFNDSINFNITYGMEGNATESEIVAAAKLANAHNFITALQQVLFTHFSIYSTARSIRVFAKNLGKLYYSTKCYNY